MKLLLATGIYPPDIGGPASFTREFAKELKELGHEPTVLCYGEQQLSSDDVWNVERVSRKASMFKRYVSYFWRTFKLLPQAEHVFFQGPISEGFPGSLACLLRRKSYVLKIVGDVAWEQYSQDANQKPELLDEFILHRHTGKYRLMEWMERWTARHAKHIFVPSQYLKSIVQKWGIDASHITVILNTVTPFEISSTREQLREKLGLTQETVIFSPGRMVPWKHFDFIIQQLPKLPASYIYVLGGDGTCLEAWKKLAQDLGVSSRVRFEGKLPRQKIGEWMQVADLHVLPSSYEGFPHVVAEAASLGLPSYVSDRGGNPETKDIFPGLVKVLPFLDEPAWLQELQNIPPRGTMSQPSTFAELVQTYLKKISSV